MLELSYRFQTRFTDSWYNQVECRKICNSLILTKKSVRPIWNMFIFWYFTYIYYMKQLFNACENSPIDFKLSDIIPLAVWYHKETTYFYNQYLNVSISNLKITIFGFF